MSPRTSETSRLNSGLTQAPVLIEVEPCEDPGRFSSVMSQAQLVECPAQLADAHIARAVTIKPAEDAVDIVPTRHVQPRAPRCRCSGFIPNDDEQRGEEGEAHRKR